MDDYTFIFTIQMQIVIAMNRLSAVVAKQRHNEIFSTRNGFCLIAFAAILAAVHNIPNFIQGVDVYPSMMAIWFVTVPSYVQILSKVYLVNVCGSAALVIVIYAIAYVMLRFGV